MAAHYNGVFVMSSATPQLDRRPEILDDEKLKWFLNRSPHDQEMVLGVLNGLLAALLTARIRNAAQHGHKLNPTDSLN